MLEHAEDLDLQRQLQETCGRVIRQMATPPNLAPDRVKTQFLYLYNGLQAFVIGWILDGTSGNWMLVFLLPAASRVPSAGVMAAVKA